MSDIGDFYLGSIFDVFELNSEWFDDEFLEPNANEETSKLENSTDIKNEPATKRFKTVTDNDLEHIVLDSRSKTTLQTTAWGVKILKQWLQFHEHSPEFETLPVGEMNALLKRFYAEVRTSDGNYYAKSSYVGIRAAIHRHLRQPPFNMNISILQDKEFHSANAVFCSNVKKNKAVRSG
ncbi:uncharacterized protein LOC124265754 [Haliotis rubra]|uniref:uncharacterized protein LOC124265754 n=1 Tax=Haliotis rubra TaxID=36100 RepID=UPI001EE5C806|nr:uncharacterized protein LOC124265754 [Haliotis rubra]